MKEIKTREELQNKINQLEKKISALEKSENNSSKWLENSPVCTKIIDLDFNLIYMSQAGVDALQIGDVSDYYGKSYPFLFFPDAYNIEMNKKLIIAKETGETIIHDGGIQDLKGNKLWFQATIKPLKNDKGELDRIMVTSIDTSANKIAKEELVNSERKYRELVNLAQEGIWVIDKNNITSFVNPSMAKMLGYTEEEMLGKSLFHFMDEAGVKMANENIERRQAGIKDQHDFEFVSKNGQRIFTSIETAPLKDQNGDYDGAIAGVMDITDRKESEENLWNTNARHSALIENIGDVIAIMGIDGNIKYQSLNIEKWFGWTHDDMIHTNGWDYLHPEDIKKNQSEFGKILEQENASTKIEFRYRCKDGDYKWVELFAVNRTNDSVINGVLLNYHDITYRKEAETKLKNSEEKFRTLYNNAPDMYVSVSAKDASILLCNNTLLQATGYSKEELIGAPIFRMYHEDCMADVNDAFNLFVETREVKNKELILKRKDGSKLYVSLNVYGIRDEKGEILYSMSSWRDITELKQAEALIEVGELRFRELVNTINSGVVVYKVINDGIFGNDYIIEDMNLFALSHENKIKEEVIGKSLKELRPNIDEYGIIEVFNKVWKGGESAFYPAKLYKDDNFSNYYENRVFKLESGEIVVVFDDVTEKKEAEDKLVESEERFKTLVTQSEGIVYIIDKNGTFLLSEGKGLSSLGLKPGSVVGESVYELYKDYPKMLDDMERVFKGETVNSEVIISDAVCFQNWYTPQLSSDNEIIGLLGLSIDITKQKEAEEQIRAAEENLQNTFDISPSIIAKANLDSGYFIEANQTVSRILGYSVDEFLSRPFMEFIHPDDRGESDEERTEQMKGKEVTFFENRYLCKDGTYKWIAWHGTGANEDGIITAIGSDINERKLIEQEIIKTKQFYENVIEGVQDGIWVTDKNDKVYFANSAMEKIAGVKREQIQGKNFLTDFPDESTGELIKYYKQAKNEKRPIWYEVNVRTLGKRDIWQNGWLIPQYQNNEFVGVICTKRDVTERKEAEDVVRRLSTAVEQSPSVVVITDTNGNIEYINPKFTELTGYSNSESIGKNQNILNSGEQNKQFYQEMWQTLKAGKEWRGQFRNKRKNGELFWEAANISAILNADGEIINFIKISEDITELKQAEMKLHQSNHILNASQSIAMVGGWELDIETNNLFWTAETYRIHETTPEEFNPTVDAGVGYFLPESRQIISLAIEKAIHEGEGYDLELETYTTKGSLITVRTTCEVTVVNGKTAKLTGIFQDITKRKDAENELLNAKINAEETKDKLDLALQGSGAGLWSWNIKTGEDILDERWCGILGYKQEEIKQVVSSWENLIHPDDKEYILNVNNNGSEDEGSVYSQEYRLKCKNGKWKWIHALGKVVERDSSGNPARMSGIIIDIDERKNIEIELIKAKEKAIESDRLKSAFLANMSHEIRTPMNGILGFINLLNEPDLSKVEIEEYTTVINRGGERLLTTINDIIDISKIETGEMVIVKEEISIDNMMNELHSFFSPEVKSKGISLFYKSTAENITINTDSHKLHGILTNLIKNAIKFTHNGSVTFGYDLKEINNELDGNSVLEFFVEDTGTGVPKDRIDAIFKRFEQADIEDTKALEGSGLGLAICKAYIEMLGGDIYVESEYGKGSKFTFTIPIRAD